MRDFNRTYQSNSRGFTLLFAALVSSLLLAVGLAIFNISSKELILSSSARDSQFAFYAADTGIECALFWEFQDNAFSTSDPATSVSCADRDRVVTSSNPAPGEYVREFSIDLAPLPYCSNIQVTKFEGPPRQTIIEARGFNTCDVNNPRRVERGIRTIF